MTQLLPKIVANFSTSLAAAMATGATTGTLQSATDSDGVALPAGRYFLTIDRDNGSLEFISCSLSGTALTNIKTVSVQGTETSGTARPHRVGANVIISDFAVLKMMLNLLDGTTKFDAATPLEYDGTVSLSTNNQIATVGYVLGVVTGGTVNFSTQSVTGLAGETVVAGNIVYFKESDQRWWLADADVSATFDQVRLGVAASAGSAGNTITVVQSGPAAYFSGLTAGTKYYLSNTAGGVSSSVGTTTVFIGVATSTTTIYFAPQSIYWPTKLEKDAIAGLANFTGLIVPAVRKTAASGWLLCDGTAVSRATYATLFAVMVPTSTFTVTIASPAVFTSNSHGLVEGDMLHFTTTGSLPTGLATNTDYYVISTGLTANTFEVSTSRGGSVVNTSGSQSGTHTWFNANDGKGDGSTTFNLPNLKGKTIFGYDATDDNFDALNTPNTYVGEKTHALTEAEGAPHSHTVSIGQARSSSTATDLVAWAQQGTDTGVDVTTTSSGSGTAHNTMPPYTVRNWFIKT